MRSHACRCAGPQHEPRLIVITGGPGAGKTALIEVVRRHFCSHVLTLPEAASILFGGGFPRHATDAGLRASQRAIFRVQRELEEMVLDERSGAVALCDRGTVDGVAYWPGDPDAFFAEVGTTRQAELARYDAVIHLRTPRADGGYDHSNRVRTESAEQAAQIDERIFSAWSGHPHRFVVESSDDFMEKVAYALAIIEEQIPDCCARSAPWLVGAAAQ